MKKIIIFLLCGLLLGACTQVKDEVTRDPVQYFAFTNKSGVKVAIVPKGTYSTLPDSLVLEEGKSYFWSVDDATPIREPSDPINVYFNETVVLYYNDSFGSDFKDPRNWTNYTEKLLNEYNHEADTYTFTTEDYQRALEHQNK